MTEENEPPDGITVREALEAYSRRNLQGPHPSEGRLVGYHERLLPSEAMRRMRRHIVHCSTCTAFLLDYDDLVRPWAGGEVLSDRRSSGAAGRRPSEAAPSGDVYVLRNLRPHSAEAASVPVRTVPSWTRKLVVLLDCVATGSHEPWIGLVREEHGRVLWHGSLKSDAEGNLAILLPGVDTFLRARFIELRGVSESGSNDKVARYLFRLVQE